VFIKSFIFCRLQVFPNWDGVRHRVGGWGVGSFPPGFGLRGDRGGVDIDPSCARWGFFSAIGLKKIFRVGLGDEVLSAMGLGKGSKGAPTAAKRHLPAHREKLR